MCNGISPVEDKVKAPDYPPNDKYPSHLAYIDNPTVALCGAKLLGIKTGEKTKCEVCLALDFTIKGYRRYGD